MRAAWPASEWLNHPCQQPATFETSSTSSPRQIKDPDLVAERLFGYLGSVGHERVMAGSDCGFATFAGFGMVYPDNVYMKISL